MDRLAVLLATLSRRERLLSGLAVAILVPFLIVGQGILPLLEARGAALAELQREQDTLRWVREQAAAYPRPSASLGPRPEAAGLSEIEADLRAIGLWANVTRLEDRGDSGLQMALEDAPFTLAMDWLTRAEPALGYRAARLRIEATDDAGLIDMRVDLEPAR